jgi:hypothetical protein
MFTSIVTDSLENYSETGVTDNTELAQSTTSQLQHSNQFNITGTVSGGIPIISGSVTTGFTAQDASSQTATDSRKHATSMTQKASSRSKQEHKVTISTTTVTGTSESTTRTLKNSSPTDPIRIDYFSMMREWRVRLYRYGLRLTYDLVIPEPAGAFRQTYAYLEWLRSQIGPFPFNVPHSEIDANTWPGEKEPHYLVLADKYGAQVPPFPFLPDVIVSASPPNTPQNQAALIQMPALNIQSGFWITDMNITCHFESYTGAPWAKFQVLGTNFSQNAGAGDFSGQLLVLGSNNQIYMYHENGSLVVTVRLENTTNVWVQVQASVQPTDTAIAQWQSDVWNVIYNAAQTQYYAQQQDIAGKISQLEDRLNNVDTLTLRREESEEIMKIAIGEQFSGSEPAACCSLTQRIAYRGRNAAHVVEYHRMRTVGGHKQVTGSGRQTPQCNFVWIDQAACDFRSC